VYNLRPGITGLSQIRGRNNLPDEQKVAFDAKYLEEFGVLQDVKIVAATVFKVLRGDGVDAENHDGRT
jgi:lipopolysaccharide/colanic/teichoic acid biosynthesis glycosyltransferase